MNDSKGRLDDDMKLLTFLFILGSMSIGFAGGVAFMANYSAARIKELRAQNRSLRSTVLFLKRQKKDTIEIIYPKEEPDSYFNPF